MGKYSRATHLTCQNIITAFWQIRKNQPIEKTSVKEIIQTAGYNRSTFYAHFKDVYDLRDAAEQELLQELTARITRPIQELAIDQLESELQAICHQYGQQLQIVFSSETAERFEYQLGNRLRTLASTLLKKDDPIKVEFENALITQDLVTTIAIVSRHPEVNSDQLIHHLHQYIHGGFSQLFSDDL